VNIPILKIVLFKDIIIQNPKLKLLGIGMYLLYYIKVLKTVYAHSEPTLIYKNIKVLLKNMIFVIKKN